MPEPFTWRISAIIFRFAALRAVLKRVCGLFGRLMFGLRLDNGAMGCRTQWSFRLPSRKCRAVPPQEARDGARLTPDVLSRVDPYS